MIAAGLLATPASAAEEAYKFVVQPGTTCPTGYGPPGDRVTVILRDADGTRIDRESTTTELEDGHFRVCFSSGVTPGRRLILRGSAGVHSLVVPRFRARVDRATDVVTGRGPAGTSMSGQVFHCGPRGCGPGTLFEVTPKPDGTVREDLSAIDVRGSDYVSLIFKTGGGDIIEAKADAPYMAMGVGGRTRVRIWSSRPGLVTATLRGPGGGLRAVATGRQVAGGRSDLTFRHDGRPVTVLPGDRVDADFAADVGMTVPPLELTFDVPTASISGHCFDDQPFAVAVYPASDPPTFDSGTADPDGRFTLVVSALQSGSKVVVDCVDGHGDRLRIRGSVP